MQTIKITTAQHIEIDYELAGLGDRLLARMIDYGIFFIMYLISIFSLLIITSNFTKLGGGGFVTIVIVWLALCVFYDLICEIFFNGQSIGKCAIKIKVISLNGARPGVGQYLLRWFFRIVDFGVTLGAGAIVTVAMSDNKQRIGDIVAGTVVVKIALSAKFNDLVFAPIDDDHQTTYSQVSQLSDNDIVLIHDVIRNFNRTRNSEMVYKLAVRIKKYLNVTTSAQINEYQFLEIIVKDYKHLTAGSEA